MAPTPVPGGSERLPLAPAIVALLRERPASGGSLAKTLGVRRAVVLATCRALHRAKTVERVGNKWRLEPGGRCQGTNSAGEPCGRQAAFGETYCLHHAPEPGDRSLPEKVDANNAGLAMGAGTRWLEPVGPWLDALGDETELFLDQIEKVDEGRRRFAAGEPWTEDQAAEYATAMWLTHFLCRLALARLGEPVCECEACTDCRRYFLPAVNAAMRAGRSLPQPSVDDSAVRPQAPASDALALEPAPAESAPLDPDELITVQSAQGPMVVRRGDLTDLEDL